MEWFTNGLTRNLLCRVTNHNTKINRRVWKICQNHLTIYNFFFHFQDLETHIFYFYTIPVRNYIAFFVCFFYILLVHGRSPLPKYHFKPNCGIMNNIQSYLNVARSIIHSFFFFSYQRLGSS